MSRWSLKKTFFSLGLIPILATPLILTSCFNAYQVQFPPKNIQLNNGGDIIGLTPIEEGKSPLLEDTSGNYILSNVYENQKRPEGDFPDEGFENEDWTKYSMHNSVGWLSSMLVGSGQNIDGGYTTGQLLRALLLNKTMLASDEGYKTSDDQTKQLWNNFVILLSNTLNQSSGTFVDSNDQYLFELSNMNVEIATSKGIGIPFAGVLNALTKNANKLDYYEMQIDLTISGFGYNWFDFDGNAKAAPKIDSKQANVLKKQGYVFGEGETEVASGYTANLQKPIKISYKQYVYSKEAWTDKSTTFPVPVEELKLDSEKPNGFDADMAIFKGLEFDGIEMTDKLNIDVTNSANQTQKHISRSKPIEASQSFQVAADGMFGKDVYIVNSPVTSIFAVPSKNDNPKG